MSVPQKFGDLLQRNLVWFALGMIVMGIVGTLGFLNFLDSKIQKAIDVAVADGTIPKNKIEDLSRSGLVKSTILRLLRS